MPAVAARAPDRSSSRLVSRNAPQTKPKRQSTSWVGTGRPGPGRPKTVPYNSKALLSQSREKQVKALRDRAVVIADQAGHELIEDNKRKDKRSSIERERTAKVFGIAFDKVAGDTDQGIRLKLPAKLLNAVLRGMLQPDPKDSTTLAVSVDAHHDLTLSGLSPTIAESATQSIPCASP